MAQVQAKRRTSPRPAAITCRFKGVDLDVVRENRRGAG